MSRFAKLYTKESQNVGKIPWNVYPRPQLERDSYLCLNGEWDFSIEENAENLPKFDKKILVPFSPETLLSGVEQVPDEKSVLCYKRSFSLPKGFKKEKVLLHFGAVDQYATILLNGKTVGHHSGGYEHFSFDVTSFIEEENTLTVFVTDTLNDCLLPYGKQSKKRGGMWYTPTSGIWQTVWLESVNDEHIEDIKITTKKNRVEIKVTPKLSGRVELLGKSLELIKGKADFAVLNPNMWSPESPYLYYFKIVTKKDEVKSYFALRDLEIRSFKGKKRLFLNGKPYFFHGLLDQGYFSDGGLTPATPKCFEDDILAMKSLGFNMLRKHIKVEPEQFYYDCDRLGMVVFQDMVNSSDYSFLRDTALPTIGFIRRSDRGMHKNKISRQNFIEHMEQTVKSLYNHPSICYWTIFNEGWGQFSSSEMYDRLKKIDKTRFVDSASGWFLGGKSDVESRHVYFKKVKFPKTDKPFVLSEFGGYSFKPKGHVFNTEKTYGYGKFENREDFVVALRKLYVEEILPLKEKGLCATVYTQVSDIEDETNGLLSYDRQVLKVEKNEFLDISEKLCK